jgi:hypothetical protein
MAFEVVGVHGSFLSAGRLVTGFELEIAQLPGVQRRTCPELVLVLCQQKPDQDTSHATDISAFEDSIYL